MLYRDFHHSEKPYLHTWKITIIQVFEILNQLMTCQAVYLAPWMNFNTLTWTRYRVLRSLVRYRVEHSRESPYNNCTTTPLNFTVLNKRIDWLMDGLIDWLENNAWHYKNRCHWTLKNVIYWLFQASIRKCLNCVHNCDDHSLLDFKSPV